MASFKAKRAEQALIKHTKINNNLTSNKKSNLICFTKQLIDYTNLNRNPIKIPLKRRNNRIQWLTSQKKGKSVKKLPKKQRKVWAKNLNFPQQRNVTNFRWSTHFPKLFQNFTHTQGCVCGCCCRSIVCCLLFLAFLLFLVFWVSPNNQFSLCICNMNIVSPLFYVSSLSFVFVFS